MHPEGPSPALVSALRRLFSPLVRLLIARGVTYPYLCNVLKEVYVATAEDDFQIQDKVQTDSRISLLTGVHRKEVKRLRGSQPETGVENRQMPLGSLLVSRWTGLPEYLDEQGHPLPLPRLASEGGERSFEALVSRVNKDIRPRVILDEWLRLGIVSLDEQDRVVLQREAFVPSEGFDEKVYFLGRNLRDHIAACAQNLSDEGLPPRLERNVYHSGLTKASVEELHQLAREKGMAALQAVNQQALAMKQRDQAAPDADQRMSFGVYFHAEDDPMARDEDT